MSIAIPPPTPRKSSSPASTLSPLRLSPPRRATGRSNARFARAPSSLNPPHPNRPRTSRTGQNFSTFPFQPRLTLRVHRIYPYGRRLPFLIRHQVSVLWSCPACGVILSNQALRFLSEPPTVIEAAGALLGSVSVCPAMMKLSCQSAQIEATTPVFCRPARQPIQLFLLAAKTLRNSQGFSQERLQVLPR